MSAFSQYAAHSELCTAVHAREDVEMLAEVHCMFDELTEYPVSGDMLAVIKRGSPYHRRLRRKRAADRRAGR